MNKERLSRLITQYQKNLEFYRNAREFNEQDCRDEFISPLLESFGWDVHNEKGTSPQYKEVVVEKFSNSGDRPDYTLTLNGVSRKTGKAVWELLLNRYSRPMICR